MVKAIPVVSVKFIVHQMAEKLFIDEAFEYLTSYRKQADGAVVTWLRMFTSTLENRDNRNHFQENLHELKVAMEPLT